MSVYGKPTDFNFGFNIHDHAPDSKPVQQGLPCWSEPAREVHVIEGPVTIDWLVSEVKARIKEITNFVKMEGTLITYKDDNTNQQQRNNRRDTSALPTLKPENMSFEKRTLKILATRKAAGKFGEQVALKVHYNGQLWLWYQSINKNNSVLNFIVANFTADESTWAGKEFSLFLEQDEFDLKNRPTCELTATKSGRK